MIVEIKSSFQKFFFDHGIFWKKFYPNRPLSLNCELLHEATNELIKFFKQIENQSTNEMGKVNWLGFSLYDHYSRENQKFFITLLTLKDDNKNVYINLFKPEKNNKKPNINDYWSKLNCFKNKESIGKKSLKNLYHNYLKWLENFNKGRDKRVDFWNFLHTFKKFEWPICITKKDPNESKDNLKNYFRILLIDNCESLNDCIEFSPPDDFEINSWWLWDRFGFFNNGDEAKKVFSDLVRNYYKHLGERIGAKFLYEFPMILDVDRAVDEIWFRSIGSLSIGANEPLDFEFWKNVVFGDIQPFFQTFLTRSFFIRANLNAIRSALAAIIGRNASHTIGSHALSYLSEPGILKDYNCNHQASFNLYLQGRMDYIAEVSTTEPKWSETVEFRNHIFETFLKQHILLDNINRSIYITENSQRKELRVKKYEFLLILKDDNVFRGGKEYIYKYQESSGFFQASISNEERKQDILIDCPHGSVGKHAIYSFLENFIRNSAKHGGQEIDKILRDGDKKLIVKVEVNAETNNSNFPNDLIQIRISDNLGNCNQTIYEKINKYIEGEEKEFIKDDGSLRGGAWGIYEMRISTGWLRSSDAGEISSNSLEPKILRLIPSSNSDKNITYEFYLQRPLDYLIVSKNNTIKEDHNRGIYKIQDINELEEYYNKKLLRYKFLLIELINNDDIEWLHSRDNQLKLPLRTFIFGNGELIKKMKDLSGKFVLIEQNIDNFLNVNKEIKSCLYKKFVEWLNDPDRKKKLPRLGIMWGDLENNDNYKITNIQEKVNDGTIFLKHGLSDGDGNWINNIANRFSYFQLFSSSVPENIVGRKLSHYKKTKEESVIWELYELGLTRILIADERIFKKVCDKKIDSLEGVSLGMEYPLWEVWHWMGVEIIDIKRENKKLIVLIPDGKNYNLEDFLKNKAKNFWTHLLIHQGIIDEQIKEDFGSLTEGNCGFSSVCRNIIIHSGRGEVKIEGGFKFLELSNVEEHVVHNPSKFRLINLLANVIGGKG